ncbi:MAG: peptide chain release factor N(5)-glutamine methyltransferase [Christensenellales bacterium]|jgi:release factor glutamine methyltransferase
MTAREVFLSVKSILKHSGIAEPEANAKVIVAHALGISFADLYSNKVVPERPLKTIDNMVRRCIKGEPVEYITGKAYFRYITLNVSPDVLIPRKETELVVQRAIDLIQNNGYHTAADIGTGSGCIAISLATETQALICAVDISEKALKIAQHNAVINGVDQKISFLLSDMFKCLTDTYDIMVCNPPYVSESEYMALDDGIRLYEPKLALAAGDGLSFYRRIVKDGLRYIRSGGSLVLEIGCSQAASVMELLGQYGFSGIECQKDYQGRDRIISGRKD